METRYRTILPIVGILLVVIIALVAFFIARRVRTNQATNTASPSADLLLPDATSAPGATALATATPIGQARGSVTVTRQPQTGPEDTVEDHFATAIDDAGFRDEALTVTNGTEVSWYNLGNTSRELFFNGVSSGTVAPGNKYAYVFSTSGTYKVTTAGSVTSQTISVK